MRYREISTADFLVASAFRVVMIVFSATLIGVGVRDWASKPNQDIPFSGIVFVSILFVGSAFDLFRLAVDYFKQEMES